MAGTQGSTKLLSNVQPSSPEKEIVDQQEPQLQQLQPQQEQRRKTRPTFHMRKGKDLCIHRKFVPEQINRESMTQEEYDNFLSQPKWSRSPWYEYLKREEDPIYQRKKLKKIYCRIVKKEEASFKEYLELKRKNDRNKLFFLMKAIKYLPGTKSKKKKNKRSTTKSEDPPSQNTGL